MIGEQELFVPQLPYCSFFWAAKAAVCTQQQPFDFCFVRRKTLLLLCANFVAGKLMLVNVRGGPASVRLFVVKGEFLILFPLFDNAERKT